MFDHIKFISQQGSKSQAIRVLLSQGFSRSDIASLLHVKYQHVRNVELTPVKNPGKRSKGKKQLSQDTLNKAAKLMK